MSFSILFVCTANICRSAMAEQLLRAAVGRHSDVTVGSAGVRALVDEDIERNSAAALTELGVTPRPHHARQLTKELVEQSGLVLTATEEHRAEVVRLSPLAFRRAFTLREFARLGRDLPHVETTTEDELRARVREVAAQRGVAEAAAPGQDELGDPFGAPYAEMQRCAAITRDAVADTTRVLGLTTTSP